jgi:hypothetical protein
VIVEAGTVVEVVGRIAAAVIIVVAFVIVVVVVEAALEGAGFEPVAGAAVVGGMLVVVD